MLFKILLVIIGIYFLGKLIIRGFVSYFLGNTSKRMDEQFRQQQEEASRKQKKKDGHITIHYQPKSNKSFGKEDGDYVDYEEVK